MDKNQTIFQLIVNDMELKDTIDSSLLEYASYHRCLFPLLKKQFPLEWKKIEHINSIKQNEFLQLLDKINKLNIWYIYLKGQTMTKYYPDNIPRQSVDYDILVRDIEQYWDLHKILIKENYEIKSFPILFENQKNGCGFAKYSKKVDNENFIDLEVSIGAFLNGYMSCYSSSDLLENVEYMSINNVDIPILNNRYTLLLFIFEVAGRYQPRLRDIIDFHFMYHSLEKSDVDFVYNKLDNRYFKGILNKFIKIEKKIAKGNYKILTNDKTTFFNREILFNISIILKRDMRLKRTLYFYARLLGDHLIYKNKLMNHVVKIEELLNPKTRYELGIPTYFIPIDDEIVGECKWIKFSGYNLLRTPLGLFVASNFCIFKGDEFETLQKKIASSKVEYENKQFV